MRGERSEAGPKSLPRTLPRNIPSQLGLAIRGILHAGHPRSAGTAGPAKSHRAIDLLEFRRQLKSKSERKRESVVANMSVPAQALAIESRERGYLAKQLYVIFTRASNGIDPIIAALQDHLSYQEKLEREGVMFAAGPNWTEDEQSWEGDGMIVYRAKSLEHARDIAAQDPMHLSGARTFTARPWLVNEGTLSIRIDFATGRFSLS